MSVHSEEPPPPPPPPWMWTRVAIEVFTKTKERSIITILARDSFFIDKIWPLVGALKLNCFLQGASNEAFTFWRILWFLKKEINRGIKD